MDHSETGSLVENTNKVNITQTYPQANHNERIPQSKFSLSSYDLSFVIFPILW